MLFTGSIHKAGQIQSLVEGSASTFIHFISTHPVGIFALISTLPYLVLPFPDPLCALIMVDILALWIGLTIDPEVVLEVAEQAA